MSFPDATPNYKHPRAPHPTPFSASPYATASLSGVKHPKAPIYNPYDKFTQPEFDTWIGGITSALRHALGQPDDSTERNETAPEHDSASASPTSLHGNIRAFTSESEEDYLEDSFAEIKARHRVSKGKERDPREGPGLHLGAKDAPIEIDPDEDEEEEEEEGSGYVLPEEGYEEDEDEVEEDEVGREISVDHMVYTVLNAAQERRRQSRGESADSQPLSGEEYSDVDGDGDDHDERRPLSRSPSVEEIIELNSDGEEITPETGAQHDADADEEYDEYDYEDEDEGGIGTKQLLDNSDSARLPSPPTQPNEIHEVGEDEDEERDDAYSDDAQENPLDAEPLDVEDLDEAEIQPEDEDDADVFPPRQLNFPRRPEVQPPDIRDPWAGVATYAEDYYAGGDMLQVPSGMNPHFITDHDRLIDESPFLTPGVLTPSGEGSAPDDEDADQGAEIVQPPREDTNLEDASQQDISTRLHPATDSEFLQPAVDAEEPVGFVAEPRDHSSVRVEDDPIFQVVSQPNPNIIPDPLPQNEESYGDSGPEIVESLYGDLDVSKLDDFTKSYPDMAINGAPTTETETIDLKVVFDLGQPSSSTEFFDADGRGDFGILPAEDSPAGGSDIQFPDDQQMSDMLSAFVCNNDQPSLDKSGSEQDYISLEVEADVLNVPAEDAEVSSPVKDTVVPFSPPGDTGDDDALPEPDTVLETSVDIDPVSIPNGDVPEPQSEADNVLNAVQEPVREPSTEIASMHVGSIDVARISADSEVVAQRGDIKEDMERGSHSAEDPFTTDGPAAASPPRSQPDTEVAPRLDHSNSEMNAPTTGSPSPAIDVQISVDLARTPPSTPPLRAADGPAYGRIPMPVSADPSVPDVTMEPPHTPGTPTLKPMILSIPGTPTFLLSPVGTPGAGRPTPVSVQVPPSVLRMLQSRTTNSSAVAVGVGNTGLFTPAPGTPGQGDTSDDDGGSKDDDAEGSKVDDAEGGQNGEPGVATEVDRISVPMAPKEQEAEAEPGTLELVEQGPPIQVVGDSLLEPLVKPDEVPQEISDDTLKALSSAPANAPDVIPGTAAEISSSAIGLSSTQPEISSPIIEATLQSPSGTDALHASPYRVPSSMHGGMVLTRKSTDPILFADPYPYSLSTPGAELLGTTQSDDEQDDADISMSSDSSQDTISSESKDGVDIETKGEPSDGYATSDEELPLVYPSERNESVQRTNSQPEERQYEIPPSPELAIEDLLDPDTDADGEVDPDFVDESLQTTNNTTPHDLSLNTTKANSPAPNTDAKEKSAEPSIDPASETDPFKLMGDDSTVAPGEMHIDSSVPKLEDDTDKRSTPASISERDIFGDPDQLSPSRELTPLPESLTKDEVPDIVITPDTAQTASGRSSKRKRSQSPKGFHLTTRSMSAKNVADKRKHRSSKGKGAKSKGKGKDKAILVSDRVLETSGDAASVASVSSAGSRKGENISRASSIASSAPSDQSSILTHPSPTPARTGAAGPLLQRPSVPMIHTHGSRSFAFGVPLHHHGATSKSQPPTQVQRQPSLLQVPPLTPKPSSPIISSPSQISPTKTTPRIPSFTSTPVTRSNCRFHKISLPREEDGPRTCFIVPGCTLTDRELMEEEEIEDLGDATAEDSQRMVHNIEALNFDPWLIGVLRVLVGADLLRDHDIFWLPEPGEEPPPPAPAASPRKGDKQSASSVGPGASPSLSKILPRADHHDGQMGTSSHSRRPSIDSIASSRAPMSTAGSGSPVIGESISIRRPPRVPREKSPTPAVYSGSELSESEDEGPAIKRRKPSSHLQPDEKDAEGATTVADAGIGASTTPKTKGKQPLKPRRSRRLGQDNSPFKPGADEEASTDEEEDHSPTKQRKSGVSRGSKRARTGEEPEDDAQERGGSKKQRTQTSVSAHTES